MKVVWMGLARSYNSSSIASQKPRESVPDRTIFIPMVANTSENKAAESIKSSISVTSSMNTYRNPALNNFLRSRFIIAMLSVLRALMYAVRLKSSFVILPMA